LEYTFYSEIPKTEPFNFISEIGGILGLFIGCSFVSFFEISEVILEIIFIISSKKQKYGEQQISLENEIKNLKQELTNSKDLYKNGKINFFDYFIKRLQVYNQTQPSKHIQLYKGVDMKKYQDKLRNSLEPILLLRY
jgi:GTPase involved in cell partitioning and DNA repair